MQNHIRNPPSTWQSWPGENLKRSSSDQYDDYTSLDHQPPSIQYGLAISPRSRANIISAFFAFVGDRDVDETTNALLDAFN